MSVSVSVVMSVHNVARHIGRSLSSVLALRVPDGVTVDLTVVDDASTDGSMAVVESLLRDAPFPTRVLRHDAGRGRSAARNTGLAVAGGDYVWFVDGGDWVDDELLAALASATPADVVVADTVPVTEDGVTERPLLGRITDTVWSGPQAVEEFLFQRIRANMTNKLVRRELLSGLTFPVGRLHEDVSVMAWVLLRARTVAFVAGPAYFDLRRPTAAAGFDPRVLDLDAAVDEALFVLSGSGSPAARLHFQLRAGSMAVVHVAARSSMRELTVAAWDVIGTVRRGLHPRDAWAALRHGLPVVATGVLLIRLAPALYVRLYRAASVANRRRESRLGRPWQPSAALPAPAPTDPVPTDPVNTEPVHTAAVRTAAVLPDQGLVGAERA